MGTVMQPLKPNDPRLLAWEEYKKSDEYKNSRSWALHEEYVDGSMWAAFVKGWSMTEAALATAERERELMRKEVRRCWELIQTIALAGLSAPIGSTEDEANMFQANQARRFVSIAAHALADRLSEVRALMEAAGPSGTTG